MALTDARIRGAKPGGKAYKLSDAEGLYLLVQPHGARLWRMNYRFLVPDAGHRAPSRDRIAGRPREEGRGPQTAG